MRSDVRRYRIQEAVGKGGFGTVYRAELIGSGGFSKTVALKILNSDVEGVDEIAERLRDEARMLGLIRHRAIVQVDGLIQLNGRWTVVMEYIEGLSLKELLTQGPVPIGSALEMMSEVAAALHAAYTRPNRNGDPLKLLHRDLKPSNIQLTVSGDVKLLDFGIARADFSNREAITRSLVFGSLPYMSPERLDFEDSHAGDIYALGAVLYELVTGKKLGKTSANIHKHETRVINAIEAVILHTGSEEVADFIQSMLAYHTEDRPTAREVERRCRQLRSLFDDAWLSDWAERIIPPMLINRPPIEDDLSGTLLTENELIEVLPTEELDSQFSRATVPRLPTTEERSKRIRKRKKRLSMLLAITGLLVLLIGLISFIGGSFALIKTIDPQNLPGFGERHPPLLIESTPSGARVSVDGAVIGTTPMHWGELEPGQEYEFEVQLNGYVPAQKRIVYTGFKDQESAQLTLERLPPPGFLTVRLQGSKSAKVALDGKALSLSAPFSNYELTAGEYQLTVENRSQGIKYNQGILIRSDETKTVVVTKRRKTAPPPVVRSGTPVTVTGNALEVTLKSKSTGKRYTLPTKVPAGSYKVQARFSTGTNENATNVTITKSPMSIRCEAAMFRCIGQN